MTANQKSRWNVEPSPLPAVLDEGSESPRIREGSSRKLAHLIESWIQDPTGHDEAIWPVLERDLAETTQD
jgi:hypothetical protein